MVSSRIVKDLIDESSEQGKQLKILMKSGAIGIVSSGPCTTFHHTGTNCNSCGAPLLQNELTIKCEYCGINMKR